MVPIKEGAPRQVSDLDGLLQGRRKLILLDDNLLAHPDAQRLIEELVRRGLAVNFNQTLDLRLLTPEVAALLRRLHCANSAYTRRNLYFSLNDTRHLELMRERYALLQARHKDNVAFVCMYGFNTTLAEDVARYQLSVERLASACPNAVVMHPGPIIRGLEITGEVADGAQSAIEEQVAQGLAVRRALLARALGVRA